MANIQQQRREVFEEIYGVSIFSDVLDLFEADYNRYKNKGLSKVQDLYNRYSYAIFFMYSPSSIRNNLVRFKNIIKKNGGKYQANALETFTIDAVYSPIKSKDEARKERVTEKVLNSSDNEESVTKEALISQIEILKEELNTKSYTVASNQKEEQVRAYRILFILALATGRRFTEILKSLEMEKRGTRLTFRGLLKGNSEAIEGHIIGLSYSEVKKYLKELRKYVQAENMTESQINAKYSKVFNNALKRFGKSGLIVSELMNYFTSVKREYRGELVDGEPNVKGCRDIYAIVGSILFNDPKQDRDRTQTASRILGHSYVIQSSEGYLNK